MSDSAPVDLRHMVRDVLREVLANRTPPKAGVTETAVTETVRINDDGDLAAFVGRLATRFADPATAQRIREGSLKFTLEKSRAHSPQPAPAGGSTLEGVITETRIVRAGTNGTIVLAPGAVLTPLARDKARALGLRIERRR